MDRVTVLLVDRVTVLLVDRVTVTVTVVHFSNDCGDWLEGSCE